MGAWVGRGKKDELCTDCGDLRPAAPCSHSAASPILALWAQAGSQSIISGSGRWRQAEVGRAPGPSALSAWRPLCGETCGYWGGGLGRATLFCLGVCLVRLAESLGSTIQAGFVFDHVNTLLNVSSQERLGSKGASLPLGMETCFSFRVRGNCTEAWELGSPIGASTGADCGCQDVSRDWGLERQVLGC